MMKKTTVFKMSFFIDYQQSVFGLILWIFKKDDGKFFFNFYFSDYFFFGVQFFSQVCFHLTICLGILLLFLFFNVLFIKN